MTDRGLPLVVTITLVLLIAPLCAYAQRSERVYRLGYLGPGSPSTASHYVEAFRQGLRERGYVEGQNIVIEYRWAEGKYDRLPSMAADLVARKVDVIVAPTTTPALAAKNATTAVPIVFLIIADPVAQGLVASLARPGGNLTGLANTAGPEIYGKLLELLKEAVPSATRVAVLWNPDSPFGGLVLRETRLAARSLGVELQVLEVRRPEMFEAAFGAMIGRRAGALLVVPDSMLLQHRAPLAELAAKNRIPAIYGIGEHVEAGGLMAYAADFVDSYRRAAGYVDKILKGAKPSDLPIEQPTKFRLAVSLKTARALGLTIPPSLLLQADHVIE